MKIFITILFLSLSLYAKIATITLLKGEATIKRGHTVFDAKMGDGIESGDQLDTYKKSKMQVIFNDDTIITLGANSKYMVDSYDDKNNLHMKMTLKRGFLKTITGRIGKMAPGKFKLKTKSATIGIRGTGWKTYVGTDIENSVCFRGEITITTSHQFLEVPVGNMVLMSNGIGKKFKTDMAFFNAQIKKSEATQKQKKRLQSNNKKKKTSSKASKVSSKTSNSSKTSQGESKSTMETSTSNTSYGETQSELQEVVEAPIVKVEVDSLLENSTTIIQENLNQNFTITTTVDTPEIVKAKPDPSKGP